MNTVRRLIRATAHSILSRSLLSLGLIILATGCVNSPLPAGAKAELFAWEDRDQALVQRFAINDDTEEAFYTGNYIFSDANKDLPALESRLDQPLVLRACHEDSCYFAVVFPGDYPVNKWGFLEGDVSLTGLSTALYHQVASLPANEVRARLDALSDMVLAASVEARSYADFLALDIRREAADREVLADANVAQEAETRVQRGEKPTLLALINQDATRTSELVASREFIFSDAWDLAVNIDVANRYDTPSYLMICPEFERVGSSYEVEYDNCALKTALINGRHDTTLRMTGTTRQLLVTIFPLSRPEALEHILWERGDSGDAMVVR